MCPYLMDSSRWSRSRAEILLAIPVNRLRSRVDGVNGLPQRELHFRGSRKAVSSGGCARLDEELCEVGSEVRTNRSGIDHRLGEHRHRVRVWVLTPTQKFIENDTDREQVGGNVPLGEVSVG